VIAVTQAREDLGVDEACTALGLPRATWYRARARVSRATPGSGDQTRPSKVSPRALLPEERTVVLDHLNSERFADAAVPQVHATLLDEGRYFCSVPVHGSSVARPNEGCRFKSGFGQGIEQPCRIPE
jgi:hypothetical protein